MGAACRGSGEIAGVFSEVEPTGRRGAGCGFGVPSRVYVNVNGNDRTIGRFQVVERTPVPER